MVSLPWRRSAIPIMRACMARSRSAPTGRIRRVMLDSFFALHPSMPEFARMYREQARRGDPCGGDALSRPLAFRRPGRAGERLCRSGPGAVRLAQSRARGAAERRARAGALAVGPTTPLVLRGAAPTVGWAPVALPQADDDTAMRLVDLYSHRDPALASRAVARPATGEGRARRRHEAEAGRQCRSRDAAGGARRRQADGGR